MIGTVGSSLASDLRSLIARQTAGRSVASSRRRRSLRSPSATPMSSRIKTPSDKYSGLAYPMAKRLTPDLDEIFDDATYYRATIFRTSSKESPMSDHVYKLIELTGSSSKSIEDAV